MKFLSLFSIGCFISLQLSAQLNGSELQTNRNQIVSTSNQPTRSTQRRVIADYKQEILDPNSSPTGLADSNTYNYLLSRGSYWGVLETSYNNHFKLGAKPQLMDMNTQSNQQVHYTADDIFGNIPLVEPYTKFVRTFNNDHTLASSILFEWNTNSTSWDSVLKVNYTYDVNGNLINSLKESWSATTSTWYNSALDSYTYNSAQQLIQEVGYNTISPLIPLDTTYFREFTYIGSNKESEKIIYYSSTTGLPFTGELKSYQYDANNRVIEQQRKNLNIATMTFNNAEKILFTYGTNAMTIITQNWNTSANSYLNNDKFEANFINGSQFLNGRDYFWDAAASNWQNQPSEMDTVTYDANSNFVKLVIHNGTTSSIVALEVIRDAQGKVLECIQNENTKSIYTYDTYDQIVQVDNYEFDNTTNTWENYQNVERYYYETYENSVGTYTLHKSISACSIYPNPAVKNCYVSFSSDKMEAYNLQIVDIYGRTLATVSEKASIGDHLVKLPIEDLSIGIYLVNIYSNGKLNSSLKFTKN